MPKEALRCGLKVKYSLLISGQYKRYCGASQEKEGPGPNGTQKSSHESLQKFAEFGPKKWDFHYQFAAIKQCDQKSSPNGGH